jgi:hypothetical protein
MNRWKFLIIGLFIFLSKSNAQSRPDSILVETVRLDIIVKTYDQKTDQLSIWVKSLVDSTLGECRWFSKHSLRSLFFKDYPYKTISIVFETQNSYYVIYEHKGRGTHSHILIISKSRQNISTDLIYIGSSIKSFTELQNIIHDTFLSEEMGNSRASN